MVKLPGVVTEGGHQPAIRPLPFLTWIFYRTVSEIEGPPVPEVSLPGTFSWLRSKSPVGFCSGDSSPIVSLPHNNYCSFALLFTGERWEEISPHLDLLMQGDGFLALEPSRVLNLPLRDFFAVIWTIQASVYGANYMSPHSISLSLDNYRKINSNHGLEMTRHHWLTVTHSISTPAHWLPESDTHQMFSLVNIVQAPGASVLLGKLWTYKGFLSVI